MSTQAKRDRKRALESTRFYPFEIYLFAFALSLRLIASWRLHYSAYGLPTTGDLKFYSDWALRIAHGQWFEGHAFYGQPLYAYLLGGIFALVGYHPVIISILHSVIDAATALLIFKIARLVFAEKPDRAVVIGVAASLGWALFLPASAYCVLMISTCWVVATWWFCIWWILQRSKQARLSEWFLVACLAGSVAMMAAAVLFVLPFFFMAAIFRRSPIAALVAALGLLAGVAPSWTANTLVAHDPVVISAHGGINLWIGNNPEADGYPKVPHGLPSDQDALLRQSIVTAETEAGGPLPLSAVSRFWSAKARSYVSEHPGQWLALSALKLRNFWNAFSYDDLSSITALRDAGVLLPGLTFGIVAAFALPGCVLAFRYRRARWIIAVVLLQMVALLPVFVNERYRMPAVPGLLLLAAFFLTELGEILIDRRWRRFWPAAALLLVSVWFVTLPPPERALRSLDDYKTAKRQMAVADFDKAEFHLRRAFAMEVGPDRIAGLVGATFAEEARQDLERGQPALAQLAAERGLRLMPNDALLNALRRKALSR